MSSFTIKHKTDQPSLDGPNDLKPEVETSYIITKKAAEAAAKAKKTTKKTTK